MASMQELYAAFFSRSSDLIPSDVKELDGNLWRNLPEYVTDSLIKRLSFCERVPLRQVCRSWLEGSLSHLPTSDVELQSLPILVGNWSLTVYNVKRNAWREKSLKDVYLNDMVKGLESAGGLICAVTRHSENLLIVHNPFTNQSKYLIAPKAFKAPFEQSSNPSYMFGPPRLRSLSDIALHYDAMTGMYRSILGLVCDKQKASYTIILANTYHDTHRTTFVYDSLTNSWTECDKVPKEIMFWYGGESRIVCNESLYCLAKGKYFPQGYLECMLVKFNLCSRKWTYFPVPEDCNEDHPFLVEHRKNSMKSMPSTLWTEFVGKADQCLSRCVGKGNLIYLTGQKRKGSGVVALVFDPTRCVYKWLPELKDDHLMSELRCYEPSLQPV
ncbi:hypothetical protein AXG93_496s1010 [Marchantia polymorpha subsp. ruderalis]|uniref:F-box domain-containing protein n=1 Tax=Marchantia polymorpha subsp. ruderalis TaxID=1480154 RepID=A0A176VSK1_MARPO|nr:hypothetical protein AXG93_496s1010 [Marchantia polymorpha subsp. ruderalis]